MRAEVFLKVARSSLFGFAVFLGLSACGPDDGAVKASPKVQAPPPEERLKAAPEVVAPKALRLGKDSAGCTWLRSEGAVVVSELESPHQARAAAVSQARIAAMSDFLGVDVRSRYLDFQQEGLRDQQSLTENILQTTRNGRILKEEIEDKGYRSVGDCENCRYWVKLKTCILPTAADHDKDFRVDLNISRERFEENDEAKLTVSSTRDCYLYVYDVGMDWDTSLLVPSEFLAEAKVRAGETFTYPDDALQKRGIHLVAQLPQSRPPVSAETIRVIASKVPLPAKLTDPGSGGFLGVLQRMNASKMDWEEDAKAFTIYKTR